MRKGFSLAEILITLGIIGIIAVILIPGLIAKSQKDNTAVKLKNTYAVLNHTFQLAKADYGDYEGWEWNQIPAGDEKRVKYFWETYAFPYMKTALQCFPNSEDCWNREHKYLSGGNFDTTNIKYSSFTMLDGTEILTWASSDTSTFPHIFIYADINGHKGPNRVGKDVFVLVFIPNPPDGMRYGYIADGTDNEIGDFKYPSGLSMYGEGGGFSVEDLLSDAIIKTSSSTSSTKIGCNKKRNGLGCGYLIKLNNWKIPKEYPW